MQQSIAQKALEFVNLLQPGLFDEARDWLSESSEYVTTDRTLRGDAIIQAFEDNHEHAAERLDEITYLPGQLEKVDGLTVTVVITDQLRVDDQVHEFRDRLIITFGGASGMWKVERIENAPIEGEREKLLRFFRTFGIDWS